MTNECPKLPREEKYWNREDSETTFNALVVVVSIVLGLVISILVILGRK